MKHQNNSFVTFTTYKCCKYFVSCNIYHTSMHYRRKQSKSKSRKSRNKKGGWFFDLFNSASSETQSEEKKSSWFPSWLTPPSIPTQTAVQIPGRPVQPQPAQPVPAPPQQPQQSQQMPVPSVGGRRRGKKQQTKTKKCKK